MQLSHIGPIFAARALRQASQRLGQGVSRQPSTDGSLGEGKEAGKDQKRAHKRSPRFVAIPSKLIYMCFDNPKTRISMILVASSRKPSLSPSRCEKVKTDSTNLELARSSVLLANLH